MYAVATFLIVGVITSVFTLLASGALIATGLPPSVARFQARSAFSGAGFTTTEAENVVNHPTRRRIIASTMFFGSLGTPTLVVTVLVGLVAPGPGSTLTRSLAIVAGMIAILLAVGNRPAQRLLMRVGQRYSQRRLLPAMSGEPEAMLSLGETFTVGAIRLTETPSATSARSLRGLETTIPGVRILGIRRSDEYFGEPPVDIELREGDELVVYARNDRLASIKSSLT